MVLGPEMEGLAVSLRLAMDREGVDVESRANRLEAVFRYFRIRQLVAQQVEQQCRDQWAVDDQAGVAFGFRHVAAVVMDAGGGGGQSRITEQQDIVGDPAPFPGGSFKRPPGRRGGI